MDGINTGDCKVYSIRPLRKCASDWDDELGPEWDWDSFYDNEIEDYGGLSKGYTIDHSRRTVSLISLPGENFDGTEWFDSVIRIHGLGEEQDLWPLDRVHEATDMYETNLLVDTPDRGDRINKIIDRLSFVAITRQVTAFGDYLPDNLQFLVKSTFDNFMKAGGEISSEIKDQITILAERFTDITNFIVSNNFAKGNDTAGEKEGKVLALREYLNIRGDEGEESKDVANDEQTRESLEERLKHSFPENLEVEQEDAKGSSDRCIDLRESFERESLRLYSYLNSFLCYLEFLATMKADSDVDIGRKEREGNYFPNGLRLHPELQLNLWGKKMLTKIKSISTLYNKAINEISKEINESSLIKLFNNLINNTSLNIQEHLKKSKELMKVLSPLKLDTKEHLAKIKAFVENIRVKEARKSQVSESESQYSLGDIILADKGPVPFFQELIASSFRQAYNLYQQTKEGLNEAFNERNSA